MTQLLGWRSEDLGTSSAEITLSFFLDRLSHGLTFARRALLDGGYCWAQVSRPDLLMSEGTKVRIRDVPRAVRWTVRIHAAACHSGKEGVRIVGTPVTRPVKGSAAP